MGSLPAAVRAKPGIGSPRPIRPAALPAQADARRPRRHTARRWIYPRHAHIGRVDRHRADRRWPAVIAIQDEPGMDLALTGFLAGEIGVVHVLQALGQDMDAAQMAGLVPAL